MFNRQTVVAGVVAGVVVACGGAGLDGIGDTMRDAGEAIAGVGGSMVGGAGGSSSAGQGGAAGARSALGGMLAAAGRTMASAGRSLAGAAAGGGGVAGAEAQELAGGDGLPRPHWVLRDKRGEPVEADVAPAYLDTTPGFGSAPDCVSIAHAGQRRIGLAYRLSTGAIARHGECNGLAVEQASWRPSNGWWVFADADCEQPLSYYSGLAVSIGGTLYHSGTGAAHTPSTIYQWDASTQVCAGVANAGGRYWSFATMPQDVVGLLPAAPYSLELAY